MVNGVKVDDMIEHFLTNRVYRTIRIAKYYDRIRQLVHKYSGIAYHWREKAGFKESAILK